MSKSLDIIRLLQQKRKYLLNGDDTNGICYDGFVNEEVYDMQRFKVAVLLKETNGNDTSGNTSVSRNDWLYNYWIRHQQAEAEPEICKTKTGDVYVKEDAFYSSTYRKLCLWLAMLFDLLEETYSGIEKYFVNGSVNISKVRKVLHRVAVINLKKSWGTAVTDFDALQNYLDGPQILQTIEKQLFDYIAPQIVLCGSADVFNIACKKFSGNEIESEQADLFGKPYRVAKIRNTLFVCLYHPNYQNGKSDTQYAQYAEELFLFALSHLK